MRLTARFLRFILILACIESAAVAWPLDLHAPAECGNGESFANRVQSQRASPGDRQLAVEVSAKRDGATWIAFLNLSTGDARSAPRRLTGATCHEVLDAAALVVALALDAAPRVTTNFLFSLASPVALVPPLPPSAPPIQPPPQPPIPLDAPTFLPFAAVSIGGSTVLHEPSVGARVEVGMLRGPLEIGLGIGRFYARRSIVIGGADLRTSLWGTHVAFRLHLPAQFFASTEMNVGRLTAESAAVLGSSRTRRIALGIGGGRDLYLAPNLWLRGEISVAKTLPSKSYLIDSDDVFTSDYSLAAWISVAWRFW